MESFGERLRRLPTARDLNTSELAHMVGVTGGAIRQMESGQTKSASLLIGIRLADALDVDVRYLAVGEGQDVGANSLTDRVSALERRLASVENASKRDRTLRTQGHRDRDGR
jgi:transcriptional regulator with XRE-family HTH domain